MHAVIVLLCLLPVPLVDRLGHRSYRQRAAATRALESLGRLALPALEKGAREHPDVEARARCACLLRPWAWELADRDSRRILPKGYPRLPWIDYSCMPGEECGHHLGTAQMLIESKGAPEWAEFRAATRFWLRSQLLQCRPRSEIERRLQELVNVEVNWIRSNGHNYSPPIRLPKGMK